ncbi:MAG: SusC/RagA family TonB-linked outer membrane protein [Sphingobacteriaceae bacterium]|nr:MAG: SusC/RagA family TonB-linked outer membrane protein [Sphingobacteriaceae bacterium]
MANSYYKIYFIICFLLMLKSSYVAAQNTAQSSQGSISGNVFDEYNVPVKKALIAVKGTATRVVTDSSGKFSINAMPASMLVISGNNYYTQEVTAGSTKLAHIRLISTYLKSPERINVLYGTANANNNLSSIASIYTNQLTTTPSTLYTYALPGQLAGLYTKQNSGFIAPPTGGQTTATFIGNVVSHNNASSNDNTEIDLSLRGQNPITIIDNVQRELSSIDPESIESISVLKDGLSSILLGINSSRGVLLVTTKRPEAGKPHISFTAQTALQQPLGLPSPLSAYQYSYLYNEALQNDGRQPIYTGADFNTYRNHTDPQGHPDVNWFNTLLRSYSPLTSYRLNVGGGSAIARYTISLNYLDQLGMFKTDPTLNYNTNNDLNRYMLNSNVSVNVTKKFTVELQLFGRIQQFTQPGIGYGAVLGNLYSTPNNAYPVLNPDGSFAGTTVYTNNLLAQSQASGYRRTNSNDVLANLDLKYDLGSVLQGLSVNAKGNLAIATQGFLNRSLQNNAYILNPSGTYSAIGAPIAQSNLFNSVSSARYAFAQGSVNYDRSFGKNNVSALALYDYRTAVLNFDLPQITTNRALKAQYNYDGKYFVEGAANLSGYNRYPPGQQLGLFYAGGLGWQMAKESFISDNLKWISSWKWRATYGKTGNNNVDSYGYYNFLQTFSSTGFNYSAGTSRSPLQGYGENGLANPYISWENADKINVGADIGLFNNHINITADYYHNRYYNLLQVRGNSIALLGISYPAQNIGVNLYQGGELNLTYQNHVGNFNYFITGNVNLQAAKVVFSDEQATPFPWTLRTGQSIYAIYGYKALGFFNTAKEAASSPTTVGYAAQAGDIKYADLNADGIINQFDITTIGNTKPQLFYGTTLGFNYKGFNLSVLLQGVGHRQILFNNGLVGGFAGINFSSIGQGYEALLNRWTPETASTATLPRLSLGNPNNSAGSSLYLRSGNYVRLKNAELGYNLPFQWIEKLKVSGIRVFANGENLLTLYGYQGVDPEVYGTAYPVQRVFNAGINVKL